MTKKPCGSQKKPDKKLSVTIVITEELILNCSTAKDCRLLAILDLVTATKNIVSPLQTQMEGFYASIRRLQREFSLSNISKSQN